MNGNGSVNENKGYNFGLAGFRPHLNHKRLGQEGVTVLHSNAPSASPAGSRSPCGHHCMTWRAKAAQHPAGPSTAAWAHRLLAAGAEGSCSAEQSSRASPAGGGGDVSWVLLFSEG